MVSGNINWGRTHVKWRNMLIRPPRKPLPSLNHRKLNTTGNKKIVNIYNVNYAEITFPSNPEGVENDN